MRGSAVKYLAILTPFGGVAFLFLIRDSEMFRYTSVSQLSNYLLSLLQHTITTWSKIQRNCSFLLELFHDQKEQLLAFPESSRTL
jgi:hypothetical protein